MEREILAAQRRRVKEGPDLEARLNAATSSCFFDEITTAMHRCKGSELAFLFLSFSAESDAVGEGKVLASSYLLLGRLINKSGIIVWEEELCAVC